jgi:hypothetical protein
VDATSLIIGIFALLLTAWFGIRSMFQSLDREALQTALRAYNQALYNNLWRMGDNAEKALEASPTEAQQLAKGIADMSQTARHTLVAFSKALFAELKNQIGLRRLRLRRLRFVREQFFLAAAAQNIKRLVRFLSQPTTPIVEAAT